MTSKISFSRMVLNDSKRRLWLFILLSVGFLLTLPLVTAIFFGNQQIQLAEGSQSTWRVIVEFKQLLDRTIFFVYMGIMISAVLNAFSGFTYLYKRVKLDVFHSIPVRREKLFFIQYVSGIILFTIPFIVSYLLTIFICAANGFLTSEIAVIIIRNVGFGILHFLTYYNVAILAVMLTGKVIVGILGMIVFWSYMPLLCVIIQGLYSRFFVTYYMGDFGERLTDWLVYISPVSLQFVQAVASSSEYGQENIWRPGVLITIEVLMILLTLGVSVWLYRKRASEAAESAMAFPKTMPLIKVLIMVVLSIGMGLFFDLLAGSGAWFIFGMVLGLILSQGLIAVIYTGDIRKILTGKKSFGIATLIVIVIVAIFAFDPFGYDTYIPNSDKVKSVGISVSGLDDHVSYREFGSYVDSEKYRLQNGQVEDIPAIYNITKLGVENAKKGIDNRSIDEQIRQAVDNKNSRVTICFKMNNGSKVYRVYQINAGQMEPELAQLYDEQSFKEAEYPLLTTKNDDIGKVFVENVFTNEDRQEISTSFKQKLIEAYKEDLRELTFTDIRDTSVVGTISYEIRIGEKPSSQFDELYNSGEILEYQMSYNGEYEYRYSPIMDYPIYPACERTLTILKELGCELEGKVDINQVDEIVMERRKNESDAYGNDRRIGIVDKKELEELLAKPIYSSQNGFYQNDNKEQEMSVNFDDSTSVLSRRLIMKKEDVPLFVEEKFKTSATKMYYE